MVLTPHARALSTGAGGSRLESLYEAEHLRLVRLAALLTGDREAGEDIVQDAFAALMPRWGSLSDPGAAAGYLRVSVVNGARSWHRRSLVARRHFRVAVSTLAPPADVAALLAEEHQEVLAAVRTLPRRQREVMVLRYWGQLSEAEIAETLGISCGTVKSTASRALAAMEDRLGISNEH